ncbi:phosphatidate cytidylyltransferase [Thermodesulfobacteriota bacterium]
MNAIGQFLDPANAFDHPMTVIITIGVLALLVIAPIVVNVLNSAGRLSPVTYDELRRRCVTWVVIAFVMLGPILIGTLTVIILSLVLCLLCYCEYARATGLFRERAINIVVIVGIFLVHFAALDNYYHLFVAAWPVTATFIVATALLPDRPEGYIQRVALATFGFMMFGIWLGHFAYFANEPNFRPILIWLLVGVELNDVFAYLSGRLFGRRKLCPNTSPNKTVGGAVGAMVLTTLLVAVLGHFVFYSQPIDTVLHLFILGLIFSIAGQFGDLMLSSIKRDLGIKDMARTLPGHGGILDRFDSLLLVVPAVFHFVNYVQGVARNVPVNIITGPFMNP